MVKYLLYKIGQWLINLIPRKAAYSLAEFFAGIQFRLSPRDRQAVRKNLRAVCGPHAPLDDLSRQVFKNFGKFLVDFFRIKHDLNDSLLQDRLFLTGFEKLEKALARGQGVILLTAHLGNWELGGLLVGHLGYPVTAIALPHRERKVNELFNQQRRLKGMNVVPVNLSIRRCLRVLKDNGIVAMLADRDFTATGEPRPLFGHLTMIPKGAALFAYRTGAAVLPAFLYRNDDDTYRLLIGDLFEQPDGYPNVDEGSFVEHFLDQQAAVLEYYIREDPAQWLIFRRFWIDSRKGPEKVTHT
ncbi:MAG: lysophospholipid acyltransferase family protein [Candidatus Omnitrophota bacterium]